MEEQKKQLIQQNDELELINAQKQIQVKKLEKEVEVLKERITHYNNLAEEKRKEREEYDNSYENKVEVIETKYREKKSIFPKFEVVSKPFLVISIILGIGVIVLYSYLIGTAFFGLEDSNYILNFNVYSIILEEGGPVAFILIFGGTFLPLVASFYILDYFNNDEKNKAFFWGGVILGLDALLGYTIAKKNHIRLYDNGYVEEQFNLFSFIFDGNFWLVIIFCIIYYGIFSLSMNNSCKFIRKTFIDEEDIAKEKYQKLKSDGDNLDNEILNLSKKIDEAYEKITNKQVEAEEIKGEIELNNFKISQNNKQIARLDGLT